MSSGTADLFESAPIARRRDPVTSQLAAKSQEKKKRKLDTQLMYDLILEHPGHTAAEYANLLIARGVNWYRAARLPTKRISDLKKAGRLIVGPARRCDVTSDYAHVYYVQPD